jgi:predicted dehydrogenase
MHRRQFLKAGAAAAAPYVAPSSVLGANDRIHIGFVGVGNRAKWLIRHEDFGDTRIAAIADCFAARLAETAKLHPQGSEWARYTDYREMLERGKLDAVFVETTTHARVLIAIQAMQAGLDVYAEKPLTLTIEEGRVLANAARRYKRILQTGTQQRSIPINVYASRLVSSGRLGRIEKVTVCNFLPPERWIEKPAQAAPQGLDWDQWCNQTPLRPYHVDLHRGWMRWWDYDGGGISWGVTGWGTHALDQIQSALATDDTGPAEIWPEDKTPESRVTMRYASGTIVSLEEEKRNDHSQLGAIFQGTNGRIQILRGDFVTDRPELRREAPDATVEGPGENSYHIRDFFESMRSRRRPTADAEVGHRSTTLCHLVNITRELGRKLYWDPKAERFRNDDQANKLLTRPRRRGYELPKV